MTHVLKLSRCLNSLPNNSLTRSTMMNRKTIPYHKPHSLLALNHPRPSLTSVDSAMGSRQMTLRSTFVSKMWVSIHSSSISSATSQTLQEFLALMPRATSCSPGRPLSHHLTTMISQQSRPQISKSRIHVLMQALLRSKALTSKQRPTSLHLRKPHLI